INLPGTLRLVRMNEECLIAGKQIEEQCLVCLRKFAECFPVSEVEVFLFEPIMLAGNLHLKPERESLVRLNCNQQHIRMHVMVIDRLEGANRRNTEHHRYLRQPTRHTFACASHEWNPLPAPVRAPHLQWHECRRGG